MERFDFPIVKTLLLSRRLSLCGSPAGTRPGTIVPARSFWRNHLAVARCGASRHRPARGREAAPIGAAGQDDASGEALGEAPAGAGDFGAGDIGADVLVVGAGMAGCAVAYELAASARVLVLEAEAQPGYHATGRSAALFSETYGPAPVRALTRAGRGFFECPPEGFAAHPLLTRRGVLFTATAAQLPALETLLTEAGGQAAMERLAPDAARALVPVLRSDRVAGAALEAGARDLDVHALHAGYLQGLKARGGRLLSRAPVTALRRERGRWLAETPQGRCTAPILVNAAGAWGDSLAALAGVAPLGLVPKRRTAILFDPPAGVDAAGWPMVVDAEEQFYFKPDAGRLLGSPADATPSPPCDAQPEELDIATAAWRIEEATSLTIGRIQHRWAGLRTFPPDGIPVAGFDSESAGGAEGFFWLVGQGGYGIQTAPALARLAASLIAGAALPAPLARAGVEPAALSPARASLRRGAGAAGGPGR